MGNELFRVTHFELELVSCSEISKLELNELLKFFEPSIFYFILSLVEPARKLVAWLG